MEIPSLRLSRWGNRVLMQQFETEGVMRPLASPCDAPNADGGMAWR